MKRRVLALAAAGAIGAGIFAAPLVAAPPGTNHNNSDEHAATCSGDNELVVRAPEKLWPPNHKYYTDIYALATDGGDGPVELVTTGTHNQYDGDTGTETNGSGNTADDITINDEDAELTDDSTDAQPAAFESGTGSVQTDWQARAERSGRLQEGRTYTLTADASFSDGSSCSIDVDFTVPHDMRPSRR